MMTRIFFMTDVLELINKVDVDKRILTEIVKEAALFMKEKNGAAREAKTFPLRVYPKHGHGGTNSLHG